MESNGASRLTVRELGRPITFSFDELIKYHGTGFPGGVAHGFKVMERGFALLGEPGTIERLEVTIETAFPGPGARDAFEMVTRAVTGGRYTVDLDLAGPEVIESPRGRYFFRLIYRGGVAEMTIKPGMVRPEFLALARRQDLAEPEKERLAWLKQEMADRLMPMPASEIYNGTVRRA